MRVMIILTLGFQTSSWSLGCSLHVYVYPLVHCWMCCHVLPVYVIIIDMGTLGCTYLYSIGYDITYVPLVDWFIFSVRWLTLYVYYIVHISCVIIPVYFNHMFPFWLDHIVNTYVHYLLMSPDICYLMYTLILICPSPHRRMISPLCSTFQYYPTTNIIYLAASICM